MNTWFKLWFIPIILVVTVVWVLGASYSTMPEMKSANPIVKNNQTIEEKIIDKGVEIVQAPKGLLTANAFLGAVIGWTISKILDFGLILIKKRIKQ